MRLAVIGVGLIGGSVGLAARERLGAEVRGWDPAPGVLERAAERGAVSRACAASAADSRTVSPFTVEPSGANRTSIHWPATRRAPPSAPSSMLARPGRALASVAPASVFPSPANSRLM